MEVQIQNKYVANAFISCSLRKEDEDFVNYIERILRAQDINPVGTVGKHDASTDNPAVLMKRNIENADMVVIAATKRYFQKDMNNKKESTGISEMIQVEAGMAYAMNKPLVVFVENGTDVGNFIPNVTQYITLKCNDPENYKENQTLIFSLLDSAYRIVFARKKQMQLQNEAFDFNKPVLSLKDILIGGLIAYTTYHLLKAIFGKK